MFKHKITLSLISLSLLAFASPLSADTQTGGYTYTNATPVIATSTMPKPVCKLNKTTAAPNEKILFTPVSPTSSPAKNFTWKGEVSTTTSGPIPLAFIYPGKYTVVLRANGFDNTYIEAYCPQVNVELNAVASYPPITTSPATYLFTFATSSTKALIPRELVPISVTCLNLGQNTTIGESDAVTNPKLGVIYNLQTFLRREGYLKVDPSGYFGVLTRAAVILYQRERGLPSTGYVGPMTRAEIKSQTCLG